MTVAGSSADLTPGLRIIVTGESDDDGSITADQITILDNNPSNILEAGELPYPPPAGNEP